MKKAVSLDLMFIFIAFIITSAFAQELSVAIIPDEVVPKDGSATFRVEGGTVDQIRVQIYDLTGTKLSDSDWVTGNEYTQDFTGYRAGAYIYVVYAKVGSEEQSFRGFVYVRVQSANVRFEAGVVTVGETWQHVSFTKTFNNPVVVAKSVEGCDDPDSAKELCDYLVPRIKDVTSEGFDIMIQTIPDSATLSEPKRVPYIVAEAGRYKAGGFEIEAGTLEAMGFPFLGSNPSVVHKFNPTFNKEPVVITSITSFNGSDPATTRNQKKQISLIIGPFTIPLHIYDFREGFVSIIDEPWWDPILEHKNEKVSYIAITPGIGELDGYTVYVGNGDYISDKARTISFPGVFSEEPVVVADMQTMNGSDWAIMRYASLTNESVKLMVAESNWSLLGGWQHGTAHVQEKVGYVLAGEAASTAAPTSPTEELKAFFTATPTSGAPPLEVTFDASASTGNIVSYNWDFGDGETASGVTAQHTYESEGEFTVTLTVEDDKGNTSTAQKTITVIAQENQELVAVIKADKERCYSAPCTVNFDASNSTGPIASYDWNFGDGSDTLSGVDLVQVTHTFNDYGGFTVTLTVSDGSGNTDSTSVVISIGCASNEDCIGGDGCHEGVCMHSELTINGSADQLLAYRGTPIETTVTWTLTNVGEHAAVIKNIIPSGCESIECSVEIPSSTIVQSASLEEKSENEHLKLFLQEPSEFKFEYGEVEANLEWQTVYLSNTYSNPIVVAKPIEACSDNAQAMCDMVVVRISDVQSNSFKIKLQEWGKTKDNVLNSSHKVAYLVMEEGHYNVGSFEIEAGKFVTNNGGTPIAFKENFSQTPVLITSIVTFNGEEPAVTRNFNPCKNGIQYYPGSWVIFCGEYDFITKIQEEENRWFKWGHVNETIHYIAVSPGGGTLNGKKLEVGTTLATHNSGVAAFYSDFASEPILIADMQSTNGDDSSILRYYNKTKNSVRFFIAEEDSADNELEHKAETVGYIAIGEKSSPAELVAVIEADKDSCEEAPCTIKFDASASTGNIVSYNWDFGDGNTASGVTAQHTYEQAGTYDVTLTITDAANNTDIAMKTITVGSAPESPTEGIVLYPYESIKITQHISNLAPNEYNLGLEVKYTDLYGVSDKQVANWKPIKLQVANVGSDKFHIKLDLYDQNFCVGSDGMLGLTGEVALPKIKLSWAFTGYNAISIDECDKKPSGDFIYCDPTQFAIELAQKLQAIENLAAQGNFAELEQYKHFKAYLIGDNYSEDFQKDFAYFYTHGFLSAPSWFTSEPSPWYRYFEDPERLVFEPRKITSGLYEVTLDFNFEDEEYSFFNEGAPIAKVNVKFEKIHDVGIDTMISPFYFLPFNGLVGTMREDEDGKTERKDYGIGFTNNDDPIVLNVSNDTSIDTRASGGEDTYQTSIYRNFSELNLDPRGRALEINLADRLIKLYASQATPVIMGIKGNDNVAEAFYQLYAGDNVFGGNLNTLTYWTGIATSPALGCGDFYGNALPYKAPDNISSSFDECCAISEYHQPAFGFRWANVPNDESIFMQTVFYLPYDQRMSLSSACAGNISIFASQSGLSTKPNEALNLETMMRIQQLQDVLNLMKDELICVAPEHSNVAPVDNTYIFFWNEQELEEQLKQAKARIAEHWGFNWENYACNIPK